MIVMIESNKVDPVGLPTLLLITRMIAVKIPAKDCAINLGSGDKFRRSSHNPISPSNNAGPRTDVANQKVADVKSEIIEAEYETDITPMIIATPPRYGTGFL
jgi:hypothetical protein